MYDILANQLEFTEIKGAGLIDPKSQSDIRGSYTKILGQDVFDSNGVKFETQFKEIAYIFSPPNTKRGFHFLGDNPPKIATCIQGTSLAFVVDLRDGSKTEGKWCKVELSGDNKKVLLIPNGCTWGTYSLTDTTLIYSAARGFIPDYKPSLSKKSQQISDDWDTDRILMQYTKQ
jgi:dTDP-4-dehydrorhamnose 3,5-epimerase-like enzyme